MTAEEAWDRHGRLVHKICWRFCRKFGGEHDDYLGPAHEAFMDAWRAHRPERGEFSTLLWRSVTNALLNHLRDRKRTADHETANGATLREVAQRTAFDLELFCSELSDDAAAVVRLLLDSWRDEAMGRCYGWHQTWVLRDLRKRLGEMGWPKPRASRAFAEVSGMLT